MAGKKTPKLFTLDDMNGDAVAATLELAPGKVIEMLCWPDAVTCEIADMLLSENVPVIAMAGAVADFVKEWDFSLAEGVVYPLDRETLAKLPAKFLRRVIEVVQGVKGPLVTTPA